MSYPTHGNEYHSTPGGAAVVLYVELNSGPATSGTPDTNTLLDWDTFYDVNQDDTSLVVPAGLGLSYSGGQFTCTEDGVWIVDIGVDLVAAPGSAGQILLTVPNYGYSSRIHITAAGNPDEWHTERTIVGKVGDIFSVLQSSTGTSVTQIDGYAVMDIIRVAGALS